MVPTIHTRIRDLYDRLPSGERKLADLVLAMDGDIAAYSATELAARSGVSKATAARLFRRLGYTDYNEMRQQARAARQPGSPLEALSGSGIERTPLSLHLTRDLQNLTRTIETLRSDAVVQAIDILADAGRLWVVGLRNSFALAHYARGVLIQVKPDVRLLPQGGPTMAEDLASIGAGDAMLALAFRRRVPLLRDIVRTAARRGAGVVMLADPTIDDTARDARVMLPCLTRGASLFDSYTAPMSVLNYLCSGVALKLGTAAAARLDLIERLHDEFGDFGP